MRSPRRGRRWRASRDRSSGRRAPTAPPGPPRPRAARRAIAGAACLRRSTRSGSLSGARVGKAPLAGQRLRRVSIQQAVLANLEAALPELGLAPGRPLPLGDPAAEQPGSVIVFRQITRVSMLAGSVEQSEEDEVLDVEVDVRDDPPLAALRRKDAEL